MTREASAGVAGVTVVGPTRIAPGERRAVAIRVASLARAAYDGSDPLPGLPAPDGALDDPAAVERDLANGMHVCIAIDEAGRDVGAIRMVEETASPARWMLARLSVPPAFGGRGVGRLLFDHMEATAAARGVAACAFHAVVERERPQIWARRGYRVIDRWPSGDKPLTEVTLERDPKAPRDPLAFPWDGDDALPARGVVVTWLLAQDGVRVVTDRFDGDVHATIRAHLAASPAPAGAPGARPLLAGADVWRDGADDELALVRRRLLELGVDHGAARGVFRRALADVAPFLMPRTLDPRLLALFRFSKGLAVAPPSSMW